MAVAPDSVVGMAIGTVTDKMHELEMISERYRQNLTQSLGDIGAIKVVDVPGPARLPVPITPAPSLSTGDKPVYQRVALVMPAVPGTIDIDSLFGSLELGDLDLPPAPQMPSLAMPDAPQMGAVALPTRPLLDTTIDMPDAPQLVMPELEALEPITLPSFTFPELPDFDGVPPDVSGITVPNVFINWVEPVYESESLAAIQAKVKHAMEHGGTGLPEAVEQALFARARERQSEDTRRAVQEAVNTWAGRNFSMPPGMLAKSVDVIREDGRNRTADLNREVMIEAGRMEVENLRFMVGQGVSLEQLTTNLFENTAKRGFEMARFAAESQISVFNAQIGLFNAQNSAFETLAQVYRTRLDGALAKLQAYKVAIEGQLAVGQINQQRVEVYKARFEAVTSSVEVYKALMQGVSIRADAIKNQFDAYRTDVQAYAEQINAEKIKVDVYDARVRGETAKAGLFETQARAYASTVQAVSSQADIKVKGAQLKMEAARTKISKFLADMDQYKAHLQANLSEVQYNTSAFQAQVEVWRAGAVTEVATAEMQSRFADMNARTNIAYSEMQMAEYGSKVQQAIQQAQIALESAKAVGQYSAQLAAGAMSAAHVSASISGSGSVSDSFSNSTSNSTSHNYSY